MIPRHLNPSSPLSTYDFLSSQRPFHSYSRSFPLRRLLLILPSPPPAAPSPANTHPQTPAAHHTNNLHRRGISGSTSPSLSTLGLLPGSCWRCWRCWRCWGCCALGMSWRFARRISGVFQRRRLRLGSRLLGFAGGRSLGGRGSVGGGKEGGVGGRGRKGGLGERG